MLIGLLIKELVQIEVVDRLVKLIIYFSISVSLHHLAERVQVLVADDLEHILTYFDCFLLEVVSQQGTADNVEELKTLEHASDLRDVVKEAKKS